MTKKESKGLDKIEDVICEALGLLRDGRDEAENAVECTGGEEECDQAPEFPQKAVKKVAKALEKALVKCAQLLN